MARIALLASLVSAWTVAACSSHATAPATCDFVDEGALPAAVGDPLSGTAGNKALRDAYAKAHGLEAGYAYCEPFTLGEGWAVHILPLARTASGAREASGYSAAIAVVHKGATSTRWWSMAAPAGGDPSSLNVGFGRPEITSLVAAGASEFVLPLMAYRAVVEGDHTRITLANARVFVGIVGDRPTVFGSVLESRYRWTMPLTNGRATEPGLSELTSPPSDAEQQGVQLMWSNSGQVDVVARVDGGRELAATHTLGKWDVRKLPTKCTPELLP